MVEIMQDSRDVFYTERRKFFFSVSRYNRLRKPAWMLMKKDRRFEATYRDQVTLYREGRVEQ